MATAATDLWGQLDTSDVHRTPLSIMREQAALLGQKTGNVVEAKVVTEAQYNGYFFIAMDLVVPALDNYIYRLLKVTHPLSLYPVREDQPPFEESANEEEFVRWLGTKLSSPETRRIIVNLLSQAKS